MSSKITIVDATARRQVVNATPSTYLHEILVQACAKFKVESENYALKHNNRQIDLSQPLRLTGLPTGAKLDLVRVSRSAAPVTVALQIPAESATKLNGTVVSTDSLWMILRKFEESAGVGDGVRRNFTRRSTTPGTHDHVSPSYHEKPVLNVLGQDFSSMPDLNRTLASIGILSGNVLFKLRFEATQTPLEVAVTEHGRYFGDANNSAVMTELSQNLEANEPPSSQALESSASITTQEAHVAPPESVASPPSESLSTPQSLAQQETNKIDPPVPDVSTRVTTVFAAPTATTPAAAAIPHNPSDYEFTLAHKAIHSARLERESQNVRLPSDKEIAERAAEQESKIAAIQSVEIKFRLPDQSSVVATFTANDTSHDLYSYIRNLMTHPDEGFYLNWPAPPKVVGGRVINKGAMSTIGPGGPPKNVIRDLGMQGRVLLTLVWAEGVSDVVRRDSVLKKEVGALAKKIEVNLPPTEPSVSQSAADSKEPEKDDKDKGKGKMTGVPKWFKLGTKK